MSITIPDRPFSPTRALVRLVLAGVKRARSAVESGFPHPDWQARAELCSRCPLVVVQCGKSYCGKPLLKNLDRDEPTQGCGCPVNLKAKSRNEHCPRDEHFAASTKDQNCNCVWCESRRLENKSDQV